MNKTLSYLALVIPVSVLLWVLRNEVVAVLFERGRFSALDTTMTALALSGLMVGAFAFAAQTVVNRGFYATQNTLLPAVYGTIAVVVSLPAYWLGLKLLGVAGVGLAISVSAIIQNGLLFAMWNRRSNNTQAKTVYRTYGNSVMAAISIGAILWFLHRLIVTDMDPSTMAQQLLVIAMLSLGFLALMALWGWIFKLEVIHGIIQQVSSRLKRT